MALIGYNQSNDKLTITQLRAIQLRVHGYNADAICKLLKNSPKTSQEILRRTYAKIRCRRVGELKTWLEDAGKYLELDEVIKAIQSDPKITGGPSVEEENRRQEEQNKFDLRIGEQYSRVKWSY